MAYLVSVIPLWYIIITTYLRNATDHQEYGVMAGLEGLRKLEKLEELPWSAYVGAVGMPGRQ
jgi:hypothetical protein